MKDRMVLVDSGNIDEVENRMLDDIDYNDNDEIQGITIIREKYIESTRKTAATRNASRCWA